MARLIAGFASQVVRAKGFGSELETIAEGRLAVVGAEFGESDDTRRGAEGTVSTTAGFWQFRVIIFVAARLYDHSCASYSE